MKNKVIFLLAYFILSSCAKEKRPVGETTVKGHLLDASTSEPISGGKVYLTDGASCIIADSTITSSDGSYEFQYSNKQYSYTEIWATAKNYLTNENIGTWAANYPKPASGRQSVQNDAYEGISNQDIRLPPIGYLKYHFKQIHQSTGNTEIRFAPYDTLGVISWNGQGLDKSYTSIFPAGTKSQISYALIQNGELVEFKQDTLYIPRFDTLTYYVEF